jgi:hypothetical protein
MGCLRPVAEAIAAMPEAFTAIAGHYDIAAMCPRPAEASSPKSCRIAFHDSGHPQGGVDRDVAFGEVRA